MVLRLNPPEPALSSVPAETWDGVVDDRSERVSAMVRELCAQLHEVDATRCVTLSCLPDVGQTAHRV
eukprot:3891874-Prymnesium_polylepis.1